MQLMIATWLVFGSAAFAADVPKAASAPADDGWMKVFAMEMGEWTSTGRNPYFILEPRYQLILEGKGERLVISVTDQTRIVDGVETRMVEERETEDGELIEVSRNYFAISKKTNAVYYFGEEVDIYKDGRIAGHEGAWLSGEKGARFGLMMPGQAHAGERYYQEVAPGVAMDRAAIVSAAETMKTPAGEFKDCLKVEETTPMEPDNKEYKYYAPGIGLVRDGGLLLTKHGFPGK